MNKCQTELWSESEIKGVLVSNTESCNISKLHYKSKENKLHMNIIWRSAVMK